MTTQASFLENNISKTIADATIFASSSFVASWIFDVDPVVGAVFTATFAAVTDVLGNSLTYSFNTLGCNIEDHTYTNLCIKTLSIFGGAFIATYTAIKVFGVVAFPFGFMFTTCFMSWFIKHLMNFQGTPLSLSTNSPAAPVEPETASSELINSSRRV